MGQESMIAAFYIREYKYGRDTVHFISESAEEFAAVGLAYVNAILNGSTRDKRNEYQIGYSLFSYRQYMDYVRSCNDFRSASNLPPIPSLESISVKDVKPKIQELIKEDNVIHVNFPRN